MRKSDNMKKRVNLTFEESVLQATKRYAEKKGLSISEMVEDYLAIVSKRVKPRMIIDLIEELGSGNIDPKADLKEMFYQDPNHGG